MKEEVLFEGFYSDWNTYLPITLITWDDGSMDLHLQTGKEFKFHLAEADRALQTIGLMVVQTEDLFVAPSGAYFEVVKKR